MFSNFLTRCHWALRMFFIAGNRNYALPEKYVLLESALMDIRRAAARQAHVSGMREVLHTAQTALDAVDGRPLA